ncbi:MAG: tetratricopeptide repeat protein [candidate division KSB1 bacterium]|nr:tetratricopeptide repeat protein [candidate division KSB1 bacterium]
MSATPQEIFRNKSVVFTGKLASLPRKEAQKIVRALGGLTPRMVTKTTTFLVVGDEGFLSRIDKSRKLKKAEALNEQGGNVRIISESDFLEMAGLETKETLRAKYYPLSHIQRLYPTLRTDRVKYFEKWGLLQPVVKTHTERYFQFKDLLIFRRVHTYLQQGKSLRGIARGLRQELYPEGQLSIDFEVGRPRGRVLQFPKPVESPERTAEEWYDIGYQYDSDPSTYDKAIEAYENALAIDPEFVPAAINLGNLYYEKGQLEKAHQLYLKALELQPDNHKIHFNLGNLYDTFRDYNKAVSHYKKALELNPLFGDAHFNLAVVYEKLGRTSEAKKHWSAYLKVDNAGEWAEIAKEHLLDA